MKPSRVPSAARISVFAPGLRCLSVLSGGADAAVLTTHPTRPAMTMPTPATTTRIASSSLLRGPPWCWRRRRIRWEWLTNPASVGPPRGFAVGAVNPLSAPHTGKQAFGVQPPQAARAQVRLVRRLLRGGDALPGHHREADALGRRLGDRCAA